ncbi:hypothetical protein NQ317_000659 [Molorchus minor]|uniref:DDE Tnp4 domain-containing protein n=1 Tax=Molorchus minor TaxID=1323400 RepID=A0ABQ9J2P6_9CUCU|nr:hypothetical protein NQ317_000659 [Molorchus minor]
MDIGVQVNTSAIQTISQLISTDEQLNSITGLHSFKLLDTIEQLFCQFYLVACHHKHANLFFYMIPIISRVLSPAIFFPSKEEILSNLPKCFNNYSNVRIVLDCTEISVQKPKCLCCRVKTYSHYKSGQTLKFLVGVSPAGLITFVSRIMAAEHQINQFLNKVI